MNRSTRSKYCSGLRDHVTLWLPSGIIYSSLNVHAFASLFSLSIISVGMSSSSSAFMKRIGCLMQPILSMLSQWLFSRTVKYDSTGISRFTISLIFVKVFSKIIPLILGSEVNQLVRATVTAPPRLLPWMNTESDLVVANLKMVLASIMSPSQEGYPEESEQPRQATIRILTFTLFVYSSMQGNLVPILPAFSWKKITKGSVGG